MKNPVIDPQLRQFFEKNPRAALAFSGGADSTYLLHCAIVNGADLKAYFVKTIFQPESELRDAEHIASCLGADLTVVETDISDSRIMRNAEDRCYQCKHTMFSKLMDISSKDGRVLMDGTNASDRESERPGMRALRELSVSSPLKEHGITKEDVRRLSESAGLPTWNKPSYSCLATRIPTGTAITDLDLERIDRSEKTVRKMGFIDFRVKLNGNNAVLQFGKEEIERVEKILNEITTNISDDYDAVVLDRNPR